MSCNIIENVNLLRHALCMDILIIYHVCHIWHNLWWMKRNMSRHVSRNIDVLSCISCVMYCKVKSDNKLFWQEEKKFGCFYFMQDIICGKCSIYFKIWSSKMSIKNVLMKDIVRQVNHDGYSWWKISKDLPTTNHALEKGKNEAWRRRTFVMEKGKWMLESDGSG
jgi:hypothetical protein